jgi:hypothetical protein
MVRAASAFTAAALSQLFHRWLVNRLKMVIDLSVMAKYRSIGESARWTRVMRFAALVRQGNAPPSAGPGIKPITPTIYL